MKVWNTSAVSYEVEEQQLSPSHLLLGVHQCYYKLALQKKDLLYKAQLPIYILFFLVVYFVLGLGGVFSVQCWSHQPPTSIGSNAWNYLTSQKRSQIFGPVSLPAQQTLRLLKFQTLLKKPPSQSGSWSSLLLYLSREMCLTALCSHWWKAGLSMKSSVAVAAGGSGCPGVLMLGKRRGTPHMNSQAHTGHLLTRWCIKPAGAQLLIKLRTKGPSQSQHQFPPNQMSARHHKNCIQCKPKPRLRVATAQASRTISVRIRSFLQQWTDSPFVLGHHPWKPLLSSVANLKPTLLQHSTGANQV